MAKKIIKLWYDKEGDYLEVAFEKKAVLNVSKLTQKPLQVSLV